MSMLTRTAFTSIAFNFIQLYYLYKIKRRLPLSNGPNNNPSAYAKRKEQYAHHSICWAFNTSASVSVWNWPVPLVNNIITNLTKKKSASGFSVLLPGFNMTITFLFLFSQWSDKRRSLCALNQVIKSLHYSNQLSWQTTIT